MIILKNWTLLSKLFWKTSKLMSEKLTSIIPILNCNDKRAESDIEKATLLNTYLASQSTVVSDNRSMLQLLHAETSLPTITISREEGKDVLLNFTKAFGPDLISTPFP